MSTVFDMAPLFQSRTLLQAEGWRVCDEVCGAGPSDRPFEEQHSHFAVSAVLTGTFVYRHAAGRTLMSPGSLLVGRQSAPFSCSHEHGCGDRCVAFYFDDWWVDDLLRELPHTRSTKSAYVRIPQAQYLARLIADLEVFTTGGDSFAGEELAVRMAAAALTFSPTRALHRNATAADEKRIAALLNHLEDRIAEPLSLHGLAQKAGMSRYHFLRVFQQVTGQTPWRLILARRLALAGRHLRAQAGTVLDSATAAGFGDLSEFTRQFRHHFGMTPGAYRRTLHLHKLPVESKV